MKICITSQGQTLDSRIDPRFGRCAYFIIIDPASQEFEARENTSAQATGGAGIQAGQFICNLGVKALLTGNVGPNAFQILAAGGIDVITGVSGTVKQALSQYQAGNLKPVDGATVGSHHGMN